MWAKLLRAKYAKDQDSMDCIAKEGEGGDSTVWKGILRSFNLS